MILRLKSWIKLTSTDILMYMLRARPLFVALLLICCRCICYEHIYYLPCSSYVADEKYRALHVLNRKLQAFLKAFEIYYFFLFIRHLKGCKKRWLLWQVEDTIRDTPLEQGWVQVNVPGRCPLLPVPGTRVTACLPAALIYHPITALITYLLAFARLFLFPLLLLVGSVSVC